MGNRDLVPRDCKTMKEWKTQFTQRIRITAQNYDKLVLSRGNKTIAGKLDEILSLYFDNGGGEKEKKELTKKLKTL